MPVDVHIPTALRERTAGQKVIKANGSTVAEVIEDAVRQFPRLSGQLVTEDGSLHRFVNVYRNDEDIRYLQKLDTSVTDADVISVLPAVAGG